MDLSVNVPGEFHHADLGKNIPVTWDGFEIGSCLVSGDGTIGVITLNDTLVSREIQAKLSSGIVEHLSINPRVAE